jgi:hypothetical protein
MVKRRKGETTMLTPIKILALSKAVNGQLKPAREKVRPGKYAIDFTANIKGTMKVGKDYSVDSFSPNNPWLVLMVIAQKNEQLIKNAASIAACIPDPNDPDIKGNVDDIKKLLKHYFEFVEKQYHGQVDATLFVEA